MFMVRESPRYMVVVGRKILIPGTLKLGASKFCTDSANQAESVKKVIVGYIKFTGKIFPG